MTCERCWGDAYMRWLSDPTKSQAEHYQAILKEKEDNHCTEFEQKGCVICKDVAVFGFGNNADPVAKGRCCDECNLMTVIPARRENAKEME